MGATHFLTRTLKKVRTEMRLHVLAYNLKRMIAILGAQPMISGDKDSLKGLRIRIRFASRPSSPPSPNFRPDPNRVFAQPRSIPGERAAPS